MCYQIVQNKMYVFVTVIYIINSSSFTKQVKLLSILYIQMLITSKCNVKNIVTYIMLNY